MRNQNQNQVLDVNKDQNDDYILNQQRIIAENFIKDWEYEIEEDPFQVYQLQRRLINLKNNHSTFKVNDKRIICATFIYKNKFLFLGSSSNILSCYNLETNQLIYEGYCHDDWVVSIQVISINGHDLLVSGGGLSDQSICFYDLRDIETHNKISVIDQKVVHLKSITKIIFLEGKNILITCSSDCLMKMWKLSIKDTQQQDDVKQIKSQQINSQDGLQQNIDQEDSQNSDNCLFDHEQEEEVKSQGEDKIYNQNDICKQTDNIKEQEINQLEKEVVQNQVQGIFHDDLLNQHKNQNFSKEQVKNEVEKVENNDKELQTKVDVWDEEIKVEEEEIKSNEDHENEEDKDQNEDQEDMENPLIYLSKEDQIENYIGLKKKSNLKIDIQQINCIPESSQIYCVCESDSNFIVYGTGGDGYIKVMKYNSFTSKIRQIRNFNVRKHVWCLQRFENFKYIVGYSFQIQGQINIMNVATGQNIMSFFSTDDSIHSFRIISKLVDKNIIINNKAEFIEQSKHNIALVAASKLGMIKVVNIGEKVKSQIKHSYPFNPNNDWIPWSPISIIKLENDKDNIEYERYRIYCSTGNSQISSLVSNQYPTLVYFDWSV